MQKNLPILKIFLEATSLPYKHYRTLLKAGLPLIILSGSYIVFNHFPGNQNSSLIVKAGIGVGIFLLNRLNRTVDFALRYCHTKKP